MNENNEVMAREVNEMAVVDDQPYTEVENDGSGKIIAGVIAVVGLATGAVMLGAKKLKAKAAKDDKTKKKVKKRLKWVEIEDEPEEIETVEAEIINDDEETEK